jgi:hypothetical protein
MIRPPADTFDGCPTGEPPQEWSNANRTLLRTALMYGRVKLQALQPFTPFVSHAHLLTSQAPIASRHAVLVHDQQENHGDGKQTDRTRSSISQGDGWSLSQSNGAHSPLQPLPQNFRPRSHPHSAIGSRGQPSKRRKATGVISELHIVITELIGAGLWIGMYGCFSNPDGPAPRAGETDVACIRPSDARFWETLI